MFLMKVKVVHPYFRSIKMIMFNIGTYVEQLKTISQALGCPLIEGHTKQLRDEIFADFKAGKQR